MGKFCGGSAGDITARKGLINLTLLFYELRNLGIMRNFTEKRF